MTDKSVATSNNLDWHSAPYLDPLVFLTLTVLVIFKNTPAQESQLA